MELVVGAPPAGDVAVRQRISFERELRAEVRELDEQLRGDLRARGAATEVREGRPHHTPRAGREGVLGRRGRGSCHRHQREQDVLLELRKGDADRPQPVTVGRTGIDRRRNLGPAGRQGKHDAVDREVLAVGHHRNPDNLGLHPLRLTDRHEVVVIVVVQHHADGWRVRQGVRHAISFRRVGQAEMFCSDDGHQVGEVGELLARTVRGRRGQAGSRGSRFERLDCARCHQKLQAASDN